MVFIFLPSVSTAIFQVQACRGFWYDDGDGARGAGSAKHYFMRPQTDVRCAPSTEDPRALQQTITLTLSLTLTLTLSLTLILALSLALILTLTLTLTLALSRCAAAEHVGPRDDLADRWRPPPRAPAMAHPQAD